MDSVNITDDKQWFTCCSASQVIGSQQFKDVLSMYNKRNSGTKVAGVDVRSEDVMDDRNTRNRLIAFFKDTLIIRITGADEAARVTLALEIVGKAAKVLDCRNTMLKLGKLVKDSDEDIRLLSKGFNDE